jgi:outer membrane protein OmpA-like peptidoglycan-associated protein
MMMLKILRCFPLIGMLVLTASVHARSQADQLVHLCGQPGLTIKESVDVGPATRVHLRKGTLLAVSPQKVAPTRYLLATEMKRMGVPEKCAEYFVDQGQAGLQQGRVYFHFDSDKLTPASIAVLDSLLAKITGQGTRIRLTGNTDSVGSEAYNFSLGLQRAKSVQKYLERHRIQAASTQVLSQGEKQPIASNASPHGRRQNRRVDISWSD